MRHLFCFKWVILAALVTGCGSSSADPVGVGPDAHQLKRSRCAGIPGSPCVELTAPPLAGDADQRYRHSVLAQIG